MQQMAVCARWGSPPMFYLTPPQVRLSKTKTYPNPAINPLLKSDNSHSLSQDSLRRLQDDHSKSQTVTRFSFFMSARGGRKKSAHTHTQLRFDWRVCLSELPPSAVCRAGEEREGEGDDIFFSFLGWNWMISFFCGGKRGWQKEGGRGAQRGVIYFTYVEEGSLVWRNRGLWPHVRFLFCSRRDFKSLSLWYIVKYTLPSWRSSDDVFWLQSFHSSEVFLGCVSAS